MYRASLDWPPPNRQFTLSTIHTCYKESEDLSASKLFDQLLCAVDSSVLYLSGAKNRRPSRVNHHSTFWSCQLLRVSQSTTTPFILDTSPTLPSSSSASNIQDSYNPLHILQDPSQPKLHLRWSTSSVTRPASKCLQSLSTWGQRPRSRPT